MAGPTGFPRRVGTWGVLPITSFGRVSRVERDAKVRPFGVQEPQVVVEMPDVSDNELGKRLGSVFGMKAGSREVGLGAFAEDAGHPGAVGGEQSNTFRDGHGLGVEAGDPQVLMISLEGGIVLGVSVVPVLEPNSSEYSTRPKFMVGEKLYARA